MKTKFNKILLLLLAFMVQMTFAQERVISGVVSDDLGPVSDISVKVKGTDKGTVTDFDGNFSIKAKTGDTIEFTHVSYGSTQHVVGSSNTITVLMSGGANSLDEVIVTAQGIKKEKRALGYSVTEINSEEVENRSAGDVARILSGKSSGVQITSQGGTSGSATSVIIRGYTSINGSNQALFIVDGVPFSSDNNTNGTFDSGNVGSSRFLDLDPNNIESVNVLKGLAAATLYGSAGRNGVVLITTKSGSAGNTSAKNEVTISQSFFLNNIASLPDYQDKYGGGFDQSFGWFFSNWGPGFHADGVDGYLNDPAGLIDSDGTVQHPYSSSAFLNNLFGGNNQLLNEFSGQRYEYKPYNSVENFFKTGQISNTNINFRGNSDNGKVAYNANLGHLDEQGFTPGNSVKRVNFSVGGRAELSNKFTVNATLNYAKTDFKSPPIAASSGNGTTGFSVFGNVFFTPRNVDLMGLPYTIPETGGSIYYRNGNDILNPRWTVENAGTQQVTNRFYGSASLNFEINDNMFLTYRAGLDFYNERVTEFSNKNGVGFNSAIFGFLNSFDNNNTIWDHYVAINTKHELTEKIGLSFVGGGTSRSTVFSRQGVASDTQIVFGVLRQFNFENQLPIEFDSTRNVIGLFGEASFDYSNYLFLTISARKDWVSNLPSKNNSQFYPSVSTSFIPTSAFEGLKSESGKGLNYLKLRAGLGQSAGFPSLYPTVNRLDQSTIGETFDPDNSTDGSAGLEGAVITNTLNNTLANPDLQPELISEFEIGFDSKFWNNRITLDLSYFDRATKNLIVNKPLPPSSGYTFTRDNIGKVEGDGWEIDLGIDIIKHDNKGLNWNSRVNFTKSEQIVTEQADDQIVYAGFTNQGNASILGEQLGVLVGSRILRDDNDNLVVDAAGNYVTESQITLDDGRSIVPIIGNPNPDYVMNFTNTINYKNFNLGFQINHTKGGDISSSTIAVLYGRGLIVEDRKNTFILPGVQQGTGLPNQTQINNSQYYFSNVLFGPSELQVYDASIVRLQEVSFGYTFSKKMLDKTPFGSLSINLSGNNLWYDAYNTPKAANFDPNIAGVGVGNGRGWDYLNGPSSKRYGISLKASF